MFRQAFTAALVACLASALSCGTEDQPSVSDDYYPLAEGNYWLYLETDNDPDTEWETRPVRHEVVDFIDMNFEHDTEGALPVFVVENTFPSGGGDSDPRIYFNYDDGVRVVRKRQEVYDKETEILSEVREWEPGLLKFDRSRTAVGDEWDDDHYSYVVSIPADPAVDGDWPVRYLYQIVAPEPVTVPAGTFDCMVVHRFEIEGHNAGEQKTYFFARGVGKVKEVTAPGNSVWKVEELVEYNVQVAADGGV